SAIRVPRPLAPLTSFQKIAKRRFDDISSVAIGYALTVEHGIVTKARIGLGGVAATPLRAKDTEAKLESAPFTLNALRSAAEVLAAEATPMDDHRASSQYRIAMLRSSLERFYAQHLETNIDSGATKGESRGATCHSDPPTPSSAKPPTTNAHLTTSRDEPYTPMIPAAD